MDRVLCVVREANISIPLHGKMSIDLQDDGFFHLQKLCGRYIGTWPLVSHPPFYVYLNIFALFYNVFGELIFGIFHISDLHLAVDTFAPFGTQGLALYKIVLVAWKYKEHRRILEELYKFYKNGKDSRPDMRYDAEGC